MELTLFKGLKNRKLPKGNVDYLVSWKTEGPKKVPVSEKKLKGKTKIMVNKHHT